MTFSVSSIHDIQNVKLESAAYGVSLRTLRFYEDRRLLRPLRVGHQRLYSARDEVRLRIILVGKRLGFSLTEILRLMLKDPAEGVVVEASAEEAALAALPMTLVEDRIREMENTREGIDAVIAELRLATSRS